MRGRLLGSCLALGFFTCFVTLGYAIPSNQKACTDGTFMNDQEGNPLIVPGSQVQARIGLIPNLCVITFSAESQASYNDTVAILWSIDGGECTPLNGCPVRLKSGTGIETNTIVCVTLLGPGVHNVAPCLDIAVPVSTPSVTLYNRCTTIECQTK